MRFIVERKLQESGHGEDNSMRGLPMVCGLAGLRCGAKGAIEKMNAQTNSRENQEEEDIQSQEESDRTSPKA